MSVFLPGRVYLVVHKIMSSRLTSSNVLSTTQPDDGPSLQRDPSLKSPHLLDVIDVDGVPLSPLQRIASGLHPHQHDGNSGGPMPLVIPEALSAVALRLDLLLPEASPLALSSGVSSLFTPEQPRRWGPPEPIIHGTKATHSHQHHGAPTRIAVTPASSSFAAHTTRKANQPYETLLTPRPPVHIAVVATETFTSFYPNSHASELECSRCEALLPTTAAYCHSCGGSIVVPVVARV
jgi:hypothetical protein